MHCACVRWFVCMWCERMAGNGGGGRRRRETGGRAGSSPTDSMSWLGGTLAKSVIPTRPRLAHHSTGVRSMTKSQKNCRKTLPQNDLRPMVAVAQQQRDRTRLQATAMSNASTALFVAAGLRETCACACACVFQRPLVCSNKRVGEGGLCNQEILAFCCPSRNWPRLPELAGVGRGWPGLFREKLL